MYGDNINRNNWKKYDAGRKFFIFWKFNIVEKTADLELFGERNRSLLDLKIISPYEVLSQAYGTQQYYIKRFSENEVAHSYVMRWNQWFRQDNNMSRLDEFVMLRRGAIELDELLADQSVHPERIIRRVNERRHELENEWRNTHREIPKPLDHWDHIPEQFPVKNISNRKIVPISSKKYLDNTAKTLGNCASNYAWKIQEKESILVAMEEGEEVKWLCEYSPNGEIRQLEGKRRAKPDKETKRIFMDYAAETFN